MPARMRTVHQELLKLLLSDPGREITNDELIRAVRAHQSQFALSTVRFLRQFSTGFGDYTKEREVLFGKKTLAEIVGEIEKRREHS